MKYFLRILAFLFIGFNSGFCIAFGEECMLLSEASEFHKKLCSAGGIISDLYLTPGDERFKF